MDLELAGRKALVSGGSHGIGRSIVCELAKEGVDVAFFSRSKKNLDQTMSLLNGIGVTATPIIADALSDKDLSHVKSFLMSQWGGVDILINNVGGGGRWGQDDILKTDPNVWDEVYKKNVNTAINLTHWALPQMIQNNWGRVITITSNLARVGGGRPWFNLAKNAQTALMKNYAMRHQFARAGITFNSVAPGAIDIPNTGWEKEKRKDPKKFAAMLDELYPLGRLGLPEEVANVVLFLSSSKASLVNGASILVDGGESNVF